MQPAESSMSAEDDRGFTIADILALLLNRRWVILGVTLLIAGAGSYYSSKQPVTYDAYTTVALNPSPNRDEEITGAADGIDNSVVESEIEVIRSRNAVENLVASVGVGVVKEWLLDDNPISDIEQEQTRAVNLLLRSVKVLRRQSSYVLEVRATSPSSAGAAEIANALTENYLQSRSDAVTDIVVSGQSKREEGLEELRQELALKNQAVADFMAEKGLVSAGGSSLVEQMISETRRNLVDSRTDLYEKRARLTALYDARTSGGLAEGVVEIQDSPAIRDLRSREIEVKRRIADLDGTYGERHPTMLSAKAELDDIQSQISSEISNITASLRRSVESGEQRVSELEGELSALQRELSIDEQSKIRLQELRREADTTERIYRDLLMRSQNFQERAARTGATAKLLSRAVPSGRPSSTPLPLWVAFWSGLGLFCGLAAAIFVNLFHNKVSKPEDIERQAGVPALVSVPLVRKQFGQSSLTDHVFQHPLSTFAESFRVILSEIEFRPRNLRGRVIAITSAMAGDGKTTTSMGLASVAASSGFKVAVVDCDFRMRALSNEIKETRGDDFTPLFTLGADLNRACVGSNRYSNLHYYPLDDRVDEFDTDFPLAKTEEVITSLRENYDLILLDCAPMLALASTRFFTSMADSSIIVCRWNKTPMSALQTTVTQINKSGGHTLGAVMNAVKASVAKYYSFGDTLYYGKAGKNYYTEKS